MLGYLKAWWYERARRKRLEQHLVAYEQDLRLYPDDPTIHYGRGVALAELGQPAEALVSYDRALELHLYSPDAHYNRGLVLAELERHEEALVAFDRALELRPDDPDTHQVRGTALMRLQRREEALVAYNRALELRPDDPDTYFNRGLALLLLDRPAEALVAYDQGLDLRPEQPDAHFNRGVALADLERPEEALVAYDRALESFPDDPDTHFNRGTTLAALERHAEALVAYDRALELRPDDHGTHFNRGNVLLRLERAAEAIVAYDRALELRPDDPGVHSNRGVALVELERPNEAIVGYDRALELRPDDAEVHSNRGVALVGLERHEEAIVAYDRALELRPDDPVVHLNRGNALVRLGRHQEALVAYDRASELRPDDHVAHGRRGVCLSALERHEEALVAYDRASELRPDDHDIHFNRGVGLVELERYAEALVAYDRAIELHPDDPDIHFNRGAALILLVRPAEALAAFNRALELRPDDPDTHFNRGGALWDLGRHEEASVAYDRALELRPNPQFSEPAVKVLALSQEEAERLNHSFIGTEHILLGLIRETDGIAARVLSSLGVEPSQVRSAVESIIGRNERPAPGDIELTPGAQTAMGESMLEVRRLSDDYVGTEHLLIGLIREGEGVAARVLERLGVSLGKVRAEAWRINMHGREVKNPTSNRFDKFSEPARTVLSHAQEEAKRFNHNYIGTEHLLLGLVRETDGVAASVLNSLGVEPPQVRSAVESIIGPAQRRSPGDIGLTPGAKKVIEETIDEALNDDYVGTEHLLIGLIREGEGVAARVLESLGLSQEKVRVEAKRLIDISRRQVRPTSSRFDKFSERARRVLSYAGDEAERINHSGIGTEIILLGLVRETDGVAARVLSSLGVEPAQVRSAVESLISRGERRPRGDIGLTPRAKKAIELAVDEARRLGSHYVGTEHLLIGIMREGEGVAAGVLENLGVSQEKVRAEAERLSDMNRRHDPG